MAKRNIGNPLSYIVIMALVVSGITSWLAPKAIAWYFTPPVDIGLNCRPATEWSMAKLQLVQLIGLGVGALLGLAVWFNRRQRIREEEESLTAPPRP